MGRPRQDKNRDLLVDNLGLPGGDTLTPDAEADRQQDFRAEIGRILDGEIIGDSEVISKLLSYLADKSLTGNANGLREYTIGVEAFGKPPDYDPQEDPSVRILASKLRRKLEEHYFKEGAGSPFRIEMPRGHFALRFQAAPTANLASDPEFQILQNKVRKWRLITAALAAVVVFSFLVPLPWRSAGKPEEQPPVSLHPWTPELDLIWSPFLKSSRSILISMGTPLFTKFSSGFFRNPKINEEAEANRAEEIKRLQEHLGSPYAVPSYAYTGAGEAIGTFQLARLLQGRAGSFSVERSSTMTWDDIRHNNVIFVGPPKFNLHLADIPAEGGFVIRDGAIRNPQPRQGEQEAYRNSWAPNNTELLEDYALISRLHGLHGSGEIMALGAGSTEATWAAVEFVTQPLYASEIVRRVGLSAGKLPERYQVVLHVRFRRQVPVQITYVTHRVLDQPSTTGVAQPVTPQKAAR